MLKAVGSSLAAALVGALCCGVLPGVAAAISAAGALALGGVGMAAALLAAAWIARSLVRRRTHLPGGLR
jgi:hypothetical protein